MTDCEQTSLYFDGALTKAEEAAAIAHLATCAACQAELGDLVGLETALSRGERARAGVALSRRRWAPWLAAGGGLAVAAAAAMAVMVVRRPSPAPQLALAEYRSVEARFSARGFDRHRPYRVSRGGEDHELVPISALAELERHGDRAGLAAAQVLAGDVARARVGLEAMPASPARDSDLAAAALVAGQLDDAVRWADAALAAQPTLTAARWNRALALRGFDLPLAAAEELDAVAALGEPGWSDEAAKLAAALRGPVRAQIDDAAAFAATTRALVAGSGPPPSGDAIRRHPGPARKAFFDALAAAGTVDEARALAPMATELDELSGTDHATLALEHVLLRDFAVRRRFQARFRGFAAGELDEAGRRALVAELAAAGPDVDDIRLSTLVSSAPAGDLLPGYRALVKAADDPWFGFLLARVEGKRLVAEGDLLGAERSLVTAVADCDRGRWQLRCGNLHVDLAYIYLKLRRTDQSAASLQAARVAYRAAGAPDLEVYALSQRATTEWIRDRLPLVHGFLAELRLRSKDACTWHSFIDDLEALVAVQLGDMDAARKHLADPQRCGKAPTQTELAVAGDVARDGTAADRARADALVAAAREATPGVAALAEGVMMIERDRDAGARRVREGMAMLAGPRGDVNDEELRTWGFGALVAAAAERADWPAALALVEEELRRPAPAGCLAVASADEGRAIALVRGRDGVLRGQVDRRRVVGIDPSTVVPATLAAALEGCPSVALIARPSLHGKPGLLPPALPWAFLGAPHPTALARVDARAVIVSDTRPPASLGLPALSSVAAPPGALMVSGTAATPSQVLAELHDASYAEIHAHGLVDLDASDVSFIALSPDASGSYALTARAVRESRFNAAPVIALAACRTAAPTSPQGRRWTLPDAFLAAGASAVIAAATAIPDDQAASLFTELRQRLAAGEPPAQALAALRAARVKAGQAWAAGLVVFE